MADLRYPNESSAYREARASLLRDEQELVEKVRSLAEKRRNLPPGGQLKEDDVFEWANDGKVGQTVLGNRVDVESPRHGVAGLESHGLYA